MKIYVGNKHNSFILNKYCFLYCVEEHQVFILFNLLSSNHQQSQISTRFIQLNCMNHGFQQHINLCEKVFFDQNEVTVFLQIYSSAVLKLTFTIFTTHRDLKNQIEVFLVQKN